ncbi:MAG TPA: GntR family transcriptional regulator [Geminicoccaceae bacterium]|jgi:Transcriptional regulators|nr:GntR family transcriptional regulator [Geminicoccaceae bacterium]
MNAGVTFERVYLALKEQLGDGRFAAGQHLEPALLAQDLNVSITPVRDALHRLAGEGLVDTPRGEGFRTPAVTELGLRQLYRWNQALLALTTRLGANAPRAGLSELASGDHVERTGRLFLTIAALAGNVEATASLGALNDRLRPARRAELRVLPGPEPYLEDIAAALAEANLPVLRRTLAAYHRERERAVDRIVAALHATGEG